MSDNKWESPLLRVGGIVGAIAVTWGFLGNISGTLEEIKGVSQDYVDERDAADRAYTEQRTADLPYVIRGRAEDMIETFWISKCLGVASPEIDTIMGEHYDKFRDNSDGREHNWRGRNEQEVFDILRGRGLC